MYSFTGVSPPVISDRRGCECDGPNSNFGPKHRVIKKIYFFYHETSTTPEEEALSIDNMG